MRAIDAPHRAMRGPIAAPAGDLDRVQQDMAEIQARDLARSVRLFILQNDRMPDTLEELVGSDVIKSLPTDPWGSPFRLVVVDTEERQFQLVSAGGDGRLGTPDDVVVDG